MDDCLPKYNIKSRLKLKFTSFVAYKVLKETLSGYSNFMKVLI